MNFKTATNESVKHFNKIYNESGKSQYSQSIEESTIRDLKPILFVSRLFGIAPYTITSTKIYTSHAGIIYSGIIIIYYLYVIAVRLEIVYNQNIDVKLKVLTLARISFLLLTICADSILCVCWDQKLQCCLNSIWYYQKVLNFQEKRTNRFIIISWTLLIATFIFYSSMAIMSYLYDNDKGLVALMDITIFPAITFSVLKFLSFVIVIRRRFRDLNSYLMEDPSASGKIDIGRTCNFQNLCLLHDQLTSALKDINSLYSIQLFLWISSINFNIISRNYQLFVIKTFRYFYNDMREILFLIYYIIILTSLAIVCQMTAKEANKISSIMFSPKCFRMHSQTIKNDSITIGHYFLKHSFNFTAAFGLFAVNLQLLLSIAGAVTTYFVILLH